MPEEFIVTPWEVRGEIDYDKLIDRFGTQKVTADLLRRIEKHASPLHVMIRRGIFYSHRDMDWILDQHEEGNTFYLYTGRGPSGHTHLGHLMPWILCKWLQDHFKNEFYFQLTEDEKFMFDDSKTLDDTRKFAYENALDVVALGFHPSRTRIFLDTEYIHNLYPIAIRVARRVTFSTVRAVFGFNQSNNIGTIFYTSIQAAPAFLGSVLEGRNIPCLIPCGIDQDPHFRIARDVAEHLGFFKPALLHNKLLPSLTGSDKMSASIPGSSIYTTDSEEEVRKKIRNAFTGGRVSIEEQKKHGGNPDVCSVYKYYLYLFLPDDKMLEDRYRECRSGSIMCGECKNHLISLVWGFLKTHQEKREKARKVLEKFMLRD
ncbi:MAG: tryptophan--tRNA ligase [Thermoplasmata archaeon]